MESDNRPEGTEVIGAGRFEELVEAFQHAFSDYLVDVAMDGQKLRKMLRRRSVDLNHSMASLEGRRIVGFVLNGVRVTHGTKTGYDAGTGVRPGHRGSGLGSRLIEDTLAHLRGIGVERYLLEVLTENDAAIALYEQAGFEVTRRLRCFKTTRLAIADESVPGIATRTIPVGDVQWSSVRPSRLFEPSWQNDMEFLPASPGTEDPGAKDDPMAIVAETGEDVRGFLICDADGGAILDVGLSTPESDASSGTEDQILSLLLQEMRTLRQAWENGSDGRGTEDSGSGEWEIQFLNVDTASSRALSLLERFGFVPFIDQYEMSRAL